ncbi:hypothetical protein [Brevifollis gellanilyticus]|uniref:Uncharacterized protein n=1 Tax=Brevifollis gellanilyticus TaxID=748831 RepID=A0A512M3C0_9BACT|nr:hypothetical protein [Brevifollis gellanilyticus]GEP41244.1 hypothetical protein BGE01nite_05350 [Brevifollis gellanilyticus]
MNPKQLACVVLMIFIGIVTYCAQTVHQKVTAMRKEAAGAEDAANAADTARQTAEILVTKTRAETEELRRFLAAWLPFTQRTQTEQDVENAFDFSLRERGISLVNSRSSSSKASRGDKFMPKVIQTKLVIEDEYAKVMNWFGDIEKRLPLAKVTACSLTGGSTVRQMRLDVTIETPIVDAGATLDVKEDKKKKS